MIDYKLIAKTIKESKYAVAFTGAGISVESGVPPFRGPDGLWEKHGSQFAEISYFTRYPKESWQSLKKVFYEPIDNVKPNKAHIVLANLEKAGIMHSVITQNIDNLHQEAGSKIVYELHGTAKYAVCMKCKNKYKINKEILSMNPPVCEKCSSVWVTGEEWKYENWAPGEPNNSSNMISNENRVVIWNNSGQWNDLNDKNINEQNGFVW